jgi:hypothetical protein
MKRWAHLSFSNDTSLDITTSGLEAHDDDVDAEVTTLTAHKTSISDNEDPDPNKCLSVSVTMYVPVMVVNPPSDFDIDKVRSTILNQVAQPNHQQDELMVMHDKILLDNVIRQLIHTDRLVFDIIQEFSPGASEVSLYELFRKEYQCTPGEYREKHRPNRPEEPSEHDQPFDFTVMVRQIQHPTINSGFEYDISTTLQIPFLVNDLYEYRAQVITTAGQCPITDPYEFLKSKHREKFNNLIVSTVTPFFHGQLNIAYMQTLPQPNYVGGMPGPDRQWARPGTSQPDFGR